MDRSRRTRAKRRWPNAIGWLKLRKSFANSNRSLSAAKRKIGSLSNNENGLLFNLSINNNSPLPAALVCRGLVRPLSERQRNVWMAAAIFSFSLHSLAKKIPAKKLSHPA
jgi:hypothetical protein